MKINEIYQIFLKYPKITIDSRNVPKNSLFFALKGENFDGNKYSTQAIEKGASYAIVDNKKYCTTKQHILVENVLETLQDLANEHRRKLYIPIIAITGTNGKTTTKELINTVLSEKYTTYATLGNYNNHIGVPLTLLSMDKNTEIGIIEMGANHIGEIDLLCKITDPNYGLITNIGTAHIEGFGSFEGVISAKTELYKFIEKTKGTIFLNSDNKILTNELAKQKIITYGTNISSETKGNIINSDPFINIDYTTKAQTYKIKTKLIGKYNLENILAAISIGNYFNVSTEQIIKAIENYSPTNNRSQLLKTENNTLILDLYNANPSSMSAALENFKELSAENKVLILGDMLELGKVTNTEHKKIIKLAEKYLFKEVYLVGEVFNKINSVKNFRSYTNVDDLKKHLSENIQKNKTILIKGSRGIHLEEVISML